MESGDDDVTRYMFLTVCLGCAESGVTVSPGCGMVTGVTLVGCVESLVCSCVCLSLTSLRLILSPVCKLLAE